MNRRKIISPLAWGSGAYIVHKLLESHVEGYEVSGYNPYWTICPFLLKIVSPIRRADLIHTTADYASFFHNKRIPLVITFHNYVLDRWMRSYSSWMQRIHYATDLRFYTRLAVCTADCITAVSRFTAQLAKRDLGITRPIKIIYNGVDTDHFVPGSSPSVGRKEIRVLFSGNLTRRKGAHWLPDIAKRLDKNITIYYTQGLRGRGRLPAHRGLKPIGAVPFTKMPARYQAMDILLMPTVREGFGLAVAEAMACGLPVVASKCSAIPELVDDGKGGALCSVGDVAAFAEKINLLAESADLRKEMGEYNRSKVERLFTLDRMVNEYRELFEEILS
ncbi:MAG: glycosyltransferase family 4 protein [Deltaproteobacteria bacterium]|nr:glycosyltransferase family 4 protein [Deltaproteobacteria bacterium]